MIQTRLLAARILETIRWFLHSFGQTFHLDNEEKKNNFKRNEIQMKQTFVIDMSENVPCNELIGSC